MKGKSTFGNWYISGNGSDLSKRIFKDYANTSSKRKEMEREAVNRLINDIYIRTLTKVVRSIAQGFNGEFENEINNFIIPRLGRKNVIYDPKRHPEDRLPKQAINLNDGIFVCPERYRKGIPVWEFLKWYILCKNGGYSGISTAIEEWSGIPANLHKATYKKLVNHIVNLVQKEHDNEDKYDHGEIHIEETNTITIFWKK